MMRYLTILSLFGFSSQAMAGDYRDKVDKNVSVTFSPIHLILPMMEVTGEYRLGDQHGKGASSATDRSLS